MKKNILIIAILFIPLGVFAQAELNAWLQNTTGELGYNNQPSNVQAVHYTNTDVYVSCSCIPGYDIGPWAGNPNQAENQDFCYKITRNPTEAINHQLTGLGHIGVWTNGVSVFNAKDAFSYNNQGIWNQDALVFEGASFDECLGHPAPNGEYHNHVNPTCLYDDSDDQNHSPIIGYAFDGFPIYGAYGFENTDGTGGIKRVETGYILRSITSRQSLADGTQLSPAQYGPSVSTEYPLGSYMEDYAFEQTAGDLDQFNGRFCISPEYPDGTYAYFVTIDADRNPVFPYTIGSSYYGTVQAGNANGPGSGHNTIPNSAIVYGLGLQSLFESDFLMYPNPANDILNIEYKQEGSISIYSVLGILIYERIHQNHTLLDLKDYERGMYLIQFRSEDFSSTKSFVKR